jgi:hypothetical protein
MQRIRQQQARGVLEVLLCVHDDQPLAPLAFEPYHLRQAPQWRRLPMAPPYRHRAETVGVLLPEGGGDSVDPLPLALPLEMP